jgi:nitroimidazol reductase NimA-like FMN-containing flavoprotein (pyridoxamine 5'-phosphate oxidase superfamily)
MDRMVNLILEAPACKSTMEYETKFGFGTLHIITEDAQKKAALSLIMSHYWKQSSFVFEPSVVEEPSSKLNVIE